MLVAAVTGVDDRHAGVLRCYARRTLFVVAHGDDIRIAGYHAYRIGNAFTLGSRAVLCTCKAQYLAAKAHHGRFKAQARAGAGLKEQRGQDLPPQALRIAAAVRQNIVGQVQHFLDLLHGEVGNINQMLQGYFDSFSFKSIRRTQNGRRGNRPSGPSSCKRGRSVPRYFCIQLSSLGLSRNFSRRSTSSSAM